MGLMEISISLLRTENHSWLIIAARNLKQSLFKSLSLAKHRLSSKTILTLKAQEAYSIERAVLVVSLGANSIRMSQIQRCMTRKQCTHTLLTQPTFVLWGACMVTRAKTTNPWLVQRTSGWHQANQPIITFIAVIKVLVNSSKALPLRQRHRIKPH